VQDQWLIMRLPSGRKLYYFRPEIHTPRSTPEDPAPRPVLYYYGVNTVTRQWGRTSTYGGKLCENAVQASCRDLLARAMLRLDGAGYRIIGHVHDEPIMEETRHHQRSTEIEQMMCQNSEWDQGLPLAVELHAGARYKK
jgi:DNA polymerase